MGLIGLMLYRPLAFHFWLYEFLYLTCTESTIYDYLYLIYKQLKLISI